MFLSTIFQEDSLQESEYLLWGTPAPLITSIGSDQVSIVAKGSCSVNVTDVDVYRDKIGTEVDLSERLRPLIVKSLNVVLVEKSAAAAKFSDIENHIDQIALEVKDRLQNEIAKLGMEIIKFKIHAVGYQ